MYQNFNTSQELLELQYQLTVPDDHPVQLIHAFVESIPAEIIDQSANHLSSRGRPAVPPRLLIKAILFAYSRGIFTGRKIALMMEENVPMMWLMQGHTFSYHTINSFVTGPTTGKLLKQVFLYFASQLQSLRLISEDALFIDGTKIRADAYQYSFVWRKSTEKYYDRNQEHLNYLYDQLVEEGLVPNVSREAAKTIDGASQLQDQLEGEVEHLASELENETDPQAKKTKRQHHRTIKKYLRKLKKDYLPKLKKYSEQLETFGPRNSYSKTDKDATFMPMKEDKGTNVKSKPGYNLQIATNNQYVLAYQLFWNPTDIRTLAPFLKEMPWRSRFKYIVADAGYGCEYNYTMVKDQLKQLPLMPYATMRREMKPSYVKDLKKNDNWDYYPEDDYFIDPEGVRFNFKGYSRTLDDYGFYRDLKIYRADSFQLTEKATKAARKDGKLRETQVNPTWNYFRHYIQELLQSPEGQVVYARRSTDVEPVFARLKNLLKFRRTTMRGKQSVENQIGFALLFLNLKRLGDWYLSQLSNRETASPN